MNPKCGRLVMYGAIGVATSAARLASQSSAPPPKAAAVVVNVTPVVSQVLDRTITLPGDLSAFQDVEIRARVAGFVPDRIASVVS